mmetsp:Transcript_51244/g.165288  ORF Transcript_51244/g.165288 Transcript_51244/m.165288 type:complete len:234 (+) Transcript_51244:134-835(+)
MRSNRGSPRLSVASRRLFCSSSSPPWLQGEFLPRHHRRMPPPPRLATITPPTAELLDALPISDGPVEMPRDARALRACLVGPTNAGKSTLLNALIDSRVSIVSDKIHTTRENTLGYLTDTAAATQIEFVDAPGSLGPSVPIIRRAITEALSSADLALVVVDAAELARDTARSRRTLAQIKGFLAQLTRELSAQEMEAAGDAAAADGGGRGGRGGGGGRRRGGRRAAAACGRGE